ncbi:Pimeloyl-ACP methyl ester carboxylesterase [Actinopolyspora xinjiangensis]|uniref:Pimeloyl-ACP methyl ester carboxylesterase n=1 Tax=Actinopolyspora xinjiangensis TaxID=405564 RepID=A0A1H0V5J8_9ACTN|nr:alpha/beta hydrolase [Actinopolyspora xinjiangensis]SDP73386.1 Pimeloyl-ACP methyl ester carboxylesterase [Actinopolyspora xinjiangensis]
MFETAEREMWNPPEVFEFHGQEVRYGVMGEGTPVVLLHGTPFSSVVWRRIAPQLARHHRVYYFDLLGYGRSEKKAGQDVSLGVQNRVFAELLDHWGIDSPHVVGHDFGGTTALRTHLLDGRDYRSMTLIDPVALSPHGSEFVRTARRHEAAFGELPAYVHEAVLRAYIGGAVCRSLSEREMRYYLEPWSGDRGQAAFYRQIAQMHDRHTDEIQDRYDEVRCPVTLLWGERDAWVPLERGRALAERLPHTEFDVVPEAGHLVPEDAPEAVVAAVLDSSRR